MNTPRRGIAVYLAPGARGEAGVALAAALYALAVIGALVAGSFFAGRLEQQSGQNMFFAVQAQEAAESGLAETTGSVDAATLQALGVGSVPIDLGTKAVGEQATVRVSAARLTSRLLLIRARGERHDAAGGILATRTLGLMVQLAPGESEDPEAAGTPVVAPLAERAWVRLY